MRVRGVAHRVGAPVLREIDMRDLMGRVHAGVGASGALDADGLAGKPLDRLLNRLLHRAAVDLPLPARERRAVVLDDELVAGHYSVRNLLKEVRMALIRQFERKHMERNSVHDEIQARYTTFEREGRIFIQIDTFGRDSREIPGKKSQTIQLDRDGAFALYSILKQEFRFE